MWIHLEVISPSDAEYNSHVIKLGCSLVQLLQPFCNPLSGTTRWVDTRRINHSGFCWSRHDWVAVASTEPYASYLHFIPEDNHASTSSVRFLWAGCPSWHPTNSVKALKVNQSSEGQNSDAHIAEISKRLQVNSLLIHSAARSKWYKFLASHELNYWKN